MARNFAAFFAGFAVVFVVVSALQTASTLVYPWPEGLDATDPDFAEAFAAYVATMPPGAWIIAFGSEILGVFLGALTAAKIAGSRKLLVAGLIVGLGQIGSLMNWLSFPHPWWFIVGQIAGYALIFLAISRIVGASEGESAGFSSPKR